MIWQLMKRDRQWRGGLVFAAAMAVLTVIASIGMDVPAHDSSRDAFRANLAVFLSGETFMLMLPILAVLAARDLYEAALPLDGRDIWLSRLLVLLSIVWLPVPIGIVGGLPLITLLAGAAFVTLLVVGGKCFRIRQLGAPIMLIAKVLTTTVFVIASFMIFIRPLRSLDWSALLPSAWSVLVVCGVGSVSLFLFGWQGVPNSFSIAPLEFSDTSQHMADARPMLTRSPVFRSIYPGTSILLMFGLVAALMVSGNLSMANVAVIPFLSAFGNCRWLFALPFSRRTLFALVAAAPTFAVTVGSIAVALLGRDHLHTAKEHLMAFALNLALVYFAMFLFELSGWRPLSGLRTWTKWIPFGLAFCVMSWFSSPPVYRWFAQQRLTNSWLFLLLPAAMYWLAEKAFIEQEYPRPLVQTNRSGGLSA